MTAVLCIGAVIGTILFKLLLSELGRRTCLLFCGLLQIFGWLSLVFGYNLMHVYISRAFIGVAAGGSSLILPLYVSEITKKHNKYFPSVIMLLSRDFGIFLGCIQHLIIPIDILAQTGLVASVLFSLIFPFVQESPYYHLKNNDDAMTEKCLRWFRGVRTLEQRNTPEFLEHIESYKIYYTTIMKQNSKWHIRTLRDLRAFVCSLMLTITTQLSGCFLIINYFCVLFGKEFKSDFSVEILITMLGGTIVIGSFFGTLLIRLPIRKYIIITSSLATGICFGVLGYYMYAQKFTYNLPHENTVPLLCLLLAMFSSSSGFYPLTFVIIKEFFPQEVAATFFLVVYWSVAAVLIKFYFCFIAIIGFHGLFWLFSASCILQFLVITIMLPKTKAEREILVRI